MHFDPSLSGVNRGSDSMPSSSASLLELRRFGAARQQELEDEAADRQDPFALRLHDQAFGNGIEAGRDDARPFPVLDLDDAHPACPRGLERLVGAQCRDDDAVLPGYLKDGLPGLRFDLLIVYRQIDHFSTLYLTMIASNLQLSLQAPHFVHLAESMAWTFFRSPLAAPVGQTFAQTVQPVHFSASTL